MNVRILCDKETLFVSLKVSGQKAAQKKYLPISGSLRFVCFQERKIKHQNNTITRN